METIKLLNNMRTSNHSVKSVLLKDFGWQRIGIDVCLLLATPILQATILSNYTALAGTFGVVTFVLALAGWLSVWLARKDEPWQPKHVVPVLIGGLFAAAMACLIYGALCLSPFEVFRQCAPENVRAVLVVNFGIAILTTLVLMIRSRKFAQEVNELREKAKRGEKLVGH